MTFPLVSVAVPVMNSARYLERTLDALLAQTYPNLEIVVLDNGSTDGSDKILIQYAMDGKILWDRLRYTVSQNESWRYVLRLAKGEYVNLHRPPDVTLDPHFIERMAAPLLADPDADFSTCRLKIVVDDEAVRDVADMLDRVHGKIAEFSKVVLAITDRKQRAIKLLESSLENRVGTPYTALMKRTALPWKHWKKVSTYWPESYADWTFMNLLFLNHRGVFVDDTQLSYHLDVSNGTCQVLAGTHPQTKLVDSMYRFMMPITILTDPEFYDLRKETDGEGIAVLFQCVQRRLAEAMAATDALVAPTMAISFMEAQ